MNGKFLLSLLIAGLAANLYAQNTAINPEAEKPKGKTELLASNTTIETGMELKPAEQILKDFGALETPVGDFAPPQSPNGGYMALIHYAVAPGIEIELVIDTVNKAQIIQTMYVCKNINENKLNQNWEKIDTIDLNGFTLK